MNSQLLIERVGSGLAMVVGFSLFLYCATIDTYFKFLPIISLISSIQFLAFSELLSVRDKTLRNVNYKSKIIDYGLLFLAQYTFWGTYGEVNPFIYYDFIFSKYKLWSGFLFTTGFLYFVNGLNYENLTDKFTKLGWVLSCLFAILLSNFHIINLNYGLIWFTLPILLVVINDIGAYFSGKIFGKVFIRKPWNNLSPNKTWEGFLGGAIITIIFAMIFQFVYMEISDNTHLNQIKNYSVFNCVELPLASIQIHTAVLSLLASFICPFAGLFASGLKRAYKIKDFSNIIPGHGGIIDRVDCIFMMGVLTTIYHSINN